MSTATLLPNATAPLADPHALVLGLAPRLPGFAVLRPAAGRPPDPWARLFDDRTSSASPSVVDTSDEGSLFLRRPEPERMPVPVLLTADHAYDLEHWAEHLVNPALLVHAAALRVGREPLLLVPVGDTRRGGILPLRSLELGVRIVGLIHNRPGFHDCGLLLSTSSGEAHSVVWGETLPTGASDEESVTFYGLRSGGNIRALITPAQRQLLRSFS